MNDLQLSVNSNVTVRCIDEHGNIIRSSRLHNKATYHMVEGLLRFLRGDFTPSEYNSEIASFNTQEAYQYIPSEVRFGTVGVKMSERTSSDGSPPKPKLGQINYGEMKTPSFNEYRLQQQLKVSNRTTSNNLDAPKIKFESVSLVSFDNSNSSMGLLLHAYVPPGGLVGRNDSSAANGRFYYTDDNVGAGNGWTYWKSDGGIGGEYQSIFTEIGLFSGSGDLLARVLFDAPMEVKEENGETIIVFADDNDECNPVIQSDRTSIVIEWKIGIVSIGQNDNIISAADLRNLGMTIEAGEKGLLAEKDRLLKDLEEIQEELYSFDEKDVKEGICEMTGIEHMKSEVDRLVSEIHKVSQEIFVYEGSEGVGEVIEKLSAEIEALELFINDNDPALVQARIDSLQTEVDEIVSQQNALGLDTYEKQLARLNEEIKDVQAQIASLNKTAQDYESVLNSLLKEQKRLNAQVTQVTVATEEYTAQYNRLEKEKQARLDRIDQLQKRLEELNKNKDQGGTTS